MRPTNILPHMRASYNWKPDILSFDCGTPTGWAMATVVPDIFCKHGAIGKKGDRYGFILRVAEVIRGYSDLGGSVVLIEVPYYKGNPTPYRSLVRDCTTVEDIALLYGLEVYFITPAGWRSYMIPHALKKKREEAKRIARRAAKEIVRKDVSEDESEALLIALCGAVMSPEEFQDLRTTKKQKKAKQKKEDIRESKAKIRAKGRIKGAQRGTPSWKN